MAFLTADPCCRYYYYSTLEPDHVDPRSEDIYFFSIALFTLLLTAGQISRRKSALLTSAVSRLILDSYQVNLPYLENGEVRRVMT